MHRDIDRILIPQQRIADRVRELAADIVADHAPTDQGETDLSIVPILTGAMIFAADLMRQMPVRMKIGLMTVSSYPGAAVRSQGATVLTRQLKHVAGRRVVLVDDILDSGETLKTVVPILLDVGAISVRTAVLLRKDRPTARAVHADYVGFDIPDEFVVGYGLDYDDYYRNVPDIVTLKAEVIAQGK